MPNRTTRRILTLAAALGLALGTGMIALAQSEVQELPEQASDEAREALSEAPQPQDLETPEVDENGDSDGENAEAFSAWVQSIPEDWGCVRGQLISSVARGDHRGDDFEGPTYTSLEEAAADLQMEDRRCVEAALNGEDDDATENELEDEFEDEGQGPPDDVPGGPPEGVERGRPDGVPPGPPDHAGQGQEAFEGE